MWFLLKSFFFFCCTWSYPVYCSEITVIEFVSSKKKLWFDIFLSNHGFFSWLFPLTYLGCSKAVESRDPFESRCSFDAFFNYIAWWHSGKCPQLLLDFLLGFSSLCTYIVSCSFCYYAPMRLCFVGREAFSMENEFLWWRFLSKKIIVNYFPFCLISYNRKEKKMKLEGRWWIRERKRKVGNREKIMAPLVFIDEDVINS